MTQTADADDDGGRAGHELAQAGLDRVVRRQPGIGEGGGLGRCEPAQRHEVTGVVDEHELGHRARCAQARRSDLAFDRDLAVLLGARRAGVASPATPGPVDRHLVPDLDAGDRRPHGLHHAHALVPEGQWQSVDVRLIGQSHDELVGVARPRGKHPQEHLAATRFRSRDLDHLGGRADSGVLECLHRRLLTTLRVIPPTVCRTTGPGKGHPGVSSLTSAGPGVRCGDARGREHPVRPTRRRPGRRRRPRPRRRSRRPARAGARNHGQPHRLRVPAGVPLLRPRHDRMAWAEGPACGVPSTPASWSGSAPR